MENLLVNPIALIKKANSVKGINNVAENMSKYLEIATEIVEDWSDRWDEGEGFGSSDFTYMVKEFIDTVMYSNGKSNFYKTDFTPYLSVIEKI